MTYEAHKVIEACRDPKDPSAAFILEEPLLVARASGTCVVPKDKQRKQGNCCGCGQDAETTKKEG